MNIERMRELHTEMGVLLAGMPNASPAKGTKITDRAGLDAALAAAKGGEVIELAPGDYGNLEWKPNFANPVTLVGGSFGSVKILRYHWQHRGKGAILDGVRATYLEVKAVDGVTVRACAAEQLMIDSANDVTVEGC